MRKLIILSLLVCIVAGCVGQSPSLKNEIERLENKVQQDSILIASLRDTVAALSFPANQRLSKINRLINEGSYESARKEIGDLGQLFPESNEAKSIPALSKKIDQLIEKQKAEEERRKALGFKALVGSLAVVVDYNKVVFSNISVSNTFSFDSYGDRYYYKTADRGNKFITAAMNITSESNDPELPRPAVYSINGDTMKYEGQFLIRFARWRDYGSYLGNYHDNGNDFAKSSTVRFKIGLEVPEEITKKAYAIILKKENALVRHTDRFDDPPVSYIGTVDYPSVLNVNDFTSNNCQFSVVKIANL